MLKDAMTFSSKRYARFGGALYLILIATGLFAELFVRDKLVVSGDAAATASNILGQRSPLVAVGVNTERWKARAEATS